MDLLPFFPSTSSTLKLTVIVSTPPPHTIVLPSPTLSIDNPNTLCFLTRFFPNIYSRLLHSNKAIN